MSEPVTTVFALPPHLHDKAEPSRIDGDAHRFAAISAVLQAERAGAVRRRDELRRMPGTHGQEALERDLAIHRLSSRLRTLDRYGIDSCLGRITLADGTHRYIGRFGVTGDDGEPLLIDWRTPAAEPFFAATLAHPLGIDSRRRYRWHDGRVVDYWDEVLAVDSDVRGLSPDDQSAFIASLGTHRTSRMRDVLGTIQADQDAIIRADSRGALIVDGGPGTGKTVVALHRAAYLQYADPRMGAGKGGVLVVGPHRPYLAYVEDVLPSLGEEGVQVCAVSDFVAEGATATPEPSARAAALKGTARLLDAVEAAVRGYEQAPRHALVVETPWADVEVTAADWAEAFAAASPGATHNDNRDDVWEELLGILVDRHGDAEGAEAPDQAVRRALARDEGLAQTYRRAWPVLDPARVVADLFTVRSYLRRCAPWLDDADIDALQRRDPDAWTLSDLPLLDAARRRIGDPEAVRVRRRREALQAAESEVRARVVDELVAADDSELQVMSILQGQDADNSLADDAALPRLEPDALAGPFAHLIVDEAQELTDAQWRMLLSRCPSRSVTIVGDRAQARSGFAESWTARLERVGLSRVRQASLSINYRTPVEVMDAAAPGIRSALPDANVPLSVRSSGVPVRFGRTGQVEAVVSEWLAGNPEGTAAVISVHPAQSQHPRVRVLTPTLAKGLEFDLVVLVDPEGFGDGLTGAVDRYVAMTRATRELILLHP